MTELHLPFIVLRPSASCAPRDFLVYESCATKDLDVHVSKAVKRQLLPCVGPLELQILIKQLFSI